MYDPNITTGENAKVLEGNIDMSTAFGPTKDALSPFGTSNSSKPKTSQYESVLEKELHLHLTRKEANKINQLEAVEDDKVQALGELENANRTFHELQIMLNSLCESKQAALHATEAAKARARQLEESCKSSVQFLHDDEADVEGKIQEYYMAELLAKKEMNSAKHELANLHQDFESVVKTKLDAFQSAADAKHSAGVNRERMTILSKEIGSVRSTLAQVKVASSQAQEGYSRNMADKDARLHAKRIAKEGVVNITTCFKDEYCDIDPQVLQEMLEETNEAVYVLQDQLNTVRTSDSESLRIVTLEVEDAKEKLRDILQEKAGLKTSIKLLKLDLQKVRMNNKELKEKVRDTSLLSQKLQLELVNNKDEHETTLASETKQGDIADTTRSRIQALSLEAAHARNELDQVKRNVDVLKHEAENFTAIAKLGDEKLMLAEIGEKDINANLLRQNSRSLYNTSSKNSKIRLTIEEFESLKGKAKKAAAEREIEKSMSKVEEMNGREEEVRQRSTRISKEIDDIKAAIRHSLNQAQMAEAAKDAVETELLRNRTLLNSYNGHQSSTNSSSPFI